MRISPRSNRELRLSQRKVQATMVSLFLQCGYEYCRQPFSPYHWRSGGQPSPPEIQETKQQEQRCVPRRGPRHLGHLWLELRHVREGLETVGKEVYQAGIELKAQHHTGNPKNKAYRRGNNEIAEPQPEPELEGAHGQHGDVSSCGA